MVSKLTTLSIIAVFLSALASPFPVAGGRVEGLNEMTPKRYVYYPGTEVLAEGDVRLS